MSIHQISQVKHAPTREALLRVHQRLIALEGSVSSTRELTTLPTPLNSSQQRITGVAAPRTLTDLSTLRSVNDQLVDATNRLKLALPGIYFPVDPTAV